MKLEQKLKIKEQCKYLKKLFANAHLSKNWQHNSIDTDGYIWKNGIEHIQINLKVLEKRIILAKNSKNLREWIQWAECLQNALEKKPKRID